MQTRKWFLSVYFSLAAIAIGELFEQIVFVPNWLIGDVDANLAHFRAFKHTTDPGMFYFPLSILFFVAVFFLLKQNLSTAQRKATQQTFILFGIVFVLTLYVIIQINVPAIDNSDFSGEALEFKMQLWAILNCLRFLLPAYALYWLTQAFIAIKQEQ